MFIKVFFSNLLISDLRQVNHFSCSVLTVDIFKMCFPWFVMINKSYILLKAKLYLSGHVYLLGVWQWYIGADKLHSSFWSILTILLLVNDKNASADCWQPLKPVGDQSPTSNQPFTIQSSTTGKHQNSGKVVTSNTCWWLISLNLHIFDRWQIRTPALIHSPTTCKLICQKKLGFMVVFWRFQSCVARSVWLELYAMASDTDSLLLPILLCLQQHLCCTAQIRLVL